MSDLKFRIESILFSAGQKVSLEELSRLTKERDLERIKQALHELRIELEQKGGSIMLAQEGDFWKMTVREKYLPFVRKIVTQTELPKSVIETLAVVAFKAPVLQSKIISIRTNKAYKHLDLLEEDGYITREKKGRTKLIKLTKTFFEYFDLPPEELKKKFEGFKDLEKALEKKEEAHEAESARAETVSEAAEGAKGPEVDLVTQSGEIKKLEVYTEEPKTEIFEREEIPPPLEPAEDKLGELETYGEKEEKKEKHKKKHKKKKETTEEASEESEESEEEPSEDESPAEESEEPEETEETEAPEEERITVEKIQQEASKAKIKPKKHESTGLFKGDIPTELEKKISNRAEEIVYGEKQKPSEENEEESAEEAEMPEEESEESPIEASEEGTEEQETTEEKSTAEEPEESGEEQAETEEEPAEESEK